MNPQILTAVFFPDIFHCRIIPSDKQCRVHWYKNFSDDPAASIIRILNWSRDIRSQKTAILWSLSEEPHI